MVIIVHMCCAKIFCHQLGPLTFLTAWCYLVASFCTAERFKAYKSLDAYKYFVSLLVALATGKSELLLER